MDSRNLDAMIETIYDVEEDIQNPHKTVYLMLIDGKPIGSVRIEFLADDGEVYLSRLGILPFYQGRCLGSAFMGYIENQMCAKGIQKIHLHTALDASPARLYHKLGYFTQTSDNDRGYLRGRLTKEINV